MGHNVLQYIESNYNMSQYRYQVRNLLQKILREAIIVDTWLSQAIASIQTGSDDSLSRGRSCRRGCCSCPSC
jgi:hypothetical protein